jgi:cobalt/nickel transport protein
MEKKHIIMIIGVILISIVPFLLYQGLGEDQGYFSGTDSSASLVIENTGYQPWITPIWEPPSGEVESLLFALQAAIGAFIIGYFLGYYRKKTQTK